MVAKYQPKKDKYNTCSKIQANKKKQCLSSYKKQSKERSLLKPTRFNNHNHENFPPKGLTTKARARSSKLIFCAAENSAMDL